MKCYSFDIFDTCFVRACGNPLNLFDLLAYRILGDDSAESIRMDFSLIRVQGEKRARMLSNEEEVSLEDIYLHCDFTRLTSISNREIAQTEMEIEREQLIPVDSIRQKIEVIRQQGNSVYYISDMYLPRDFIFNLLIEHGFWKEGDHLYVSSEYRITKRFGKLYEYIAKENGLSFNQWKHIGDNRISDYIIPRKLGIHASLVKHKYSFYERFLLRQDCFPGFFVNQHLAGIAKAMRLSFTKNPRYAFAADLIAPLYVPFVYSILKDAERHGIRKMFFLARDGYILYRIAQSLQCHFKDIEVKYLYVSRSSLYLPGLSSITPRNLSLLTKTEFGFTNESKMEILGNFVTPEVLKQADNLLVGDINKDIFSDPQVLSVLSIYWQEQRNYIIDYFSQEGLADKNQKVAVVDVRGTRSCHQAINSILANNGYPLSKGYYLEVFGNRKSIKESGDYDSLYYSERFDQNSLAYISELGSAFEQYFSISPHLRTISYRKKSGIIEPVFEGEIVDENMKEIVECNESIVTLFSRLFISNKLYLHLSSVLYLSTSLIVFFSQKPIYKYLRALSSVRVNNQKGKYLYIVKRMSLRDIRDHSISWWRGALYFTIRTTLFSNLINSISMGMKKLFHRYKLRRNS